MFQEYLEIFATSTHLITMFLVPIFGPAFVLLLLYLGSYLRYFAIAYLLFIYYDWDTKDNGGHNWSWLITSKYIKLVQSYFQMSLDVEVEIPQNKNYIIGLHPHGVMILGSLALFNKQDKNHKKIIGNGKIGYCMAHYNLEIPIFREYLALIQGINASEKSILNWLSKKEVPHYALLCTGGAEEAMLTTPGVHQVVLKRRKGFCRLAIQAGSNLIPTYIFGENSIWDTVHFEPSSLQNKIQQFIYKYIKIGLPFMKGKWKYHYFFVFPKKVKLTLVSGKPVEVEQCDEPSKEQVNEVHKRYCEALTRLFDNHKVKYLGDKNAQLIIH